jgi:hypothetical protein
MVKGQDKDAPIRIALAKRKLLRLALFTISYCETLLEIIKDEGMGFEEITTLDAPLSEEGDSTLHDIAPDERRNVASRAISNVLMEQIREVLGPDWQRKITVITLYLDISKNNHNWPSEIKRQTGFEPTFISRTIRAEFPRLLRELQIIEAKPKTKTR